MKTDLLVVGGGAAGIAAAVAGAKSGMDVLVVERYGFLGGMATAAMVGTICGLYYRGKSPAKFAVRGFARKFAERIAEQSGAQVCGFEKNLHFLPYDPQVFNIEAVRTLQASGARMLLHTTISDVEAEGGLIRMAKAICPDREIEIEAGAIVDCSGEGLISNLAGQAIYEQESYQAGAFVFGVCGLPDTDQRSVNLDILRLIAKGIRAGQIDTESKRLSIVPGSLNNGAALFKLGMPVRFSNSVDARTDYEICARSRASALIKYLRQSNEALKCLSITSMAPQVGVRTSKRPVGLSLLNETDVLQCHKPVDGVAVGVWPIEYWAEETAPQMTYFSENDHYEIQAGALVSSGLSNLFFAGRGISATEMAIASARVIGTCLGTGYAAGMLAASYLSDGSWQNAIPNIRLEQCSR